MRVEQSSTEQHSTEQNRTESIHSINTTRQDVTHCIVINVLNRIE
jgi:hypothetical protein